MIAILYTGASVFNGVQLDPSRSHGNFISSSLIRAGRESVFDSCSCIFPQNSDYRLIALHNRFVATKAVQVEIIESSPIVSFSITTATPSADNQFEQILDKYTEPIYIDGVFVAAPINISLQPNQFLGVWIKRSFAEGYRGKHFSDTDFVFAENQKTKSSSFEIKITF